MRPVDPGPWPLQLSGDQVTYDEYGHARPNLVSRLGDYCSYCEMKVTSGLAVEHIVSKKDDPSRERDWANFLLACPSCNSTKARKVQSEAATAGYLWPHRDRTFEAFDYRAGAVRLAPGFVGPTRAGATEALVGLSRRPGRGLTKDQNKKGSDTRWRHRIDAYFIAKRALGRFERAHGPDARSEQLETIPDIARGSGFWSVWMTVFAAYPEVCRILVECFEGTAGDRV